MAKHRGHRVRARRNKIARTKKQQANQRKAADRLGMRQGPEKLSGVQCGVLAAYAAPVGRHSPT